MLKYQKDTVRRNLTLTGSVLTGSGLFLKGAASRRAC